MTPAWSVSLALLAGAALASASSYQCGSAGAPGSPSTTAFECLVPSATFQQTATWTAYCSSQPI